MKVFLKKVPSPLLRVAVAKGISSGILAKVVFKKRWPRLSAAVS